jgi:uncharacterized protein
MGKKMMENRLTGEIFYGMILTGAKQVIVNEGELNRLNVFPVADRDTGTNLASMMRYIVDNLSITKAPEELLFQLSQHGLVGCSGNSGLIFSQFFYGLTKHRLSNKTYVRLQDFAVMIMSGYKSAYESVSQPKAGTILTVMEQWANSYRGLLHNTKISFVEVFQKSVETAREAVKETINQLEVLRKNNVIDAGAQGFLHFIEGMLLFLKADVTTRQKILDTQSVATSIEISHEFEKLVEYPDRRYCFEIVLRVAKDDNILEKERAYLETLGDSMVIGHAAQMEKLHIHTNNPEIITKHLAQHGNVIYQKIDDMIMQYEVSNQENLGTAIVIDSMADLPQEWVRENNVFTLPLQVKINDNSFLDKFTVNYQDVVGYLKNPKNQVSTAAPSTSITSRSLHFLSQHYKSLIVLSFTSASSSTYDVIVNQARKLQNYKINVIDSCTNSAALGLLVMYAQKLIAAKHTHDEVVDKINQAKIGANFLVFIDSLDQLIKSGRLSGRAGFFAKLLRVKPLVKLDSQGRPQVISIAFTRRGGWRKLLKHLQDLKSKNTLGEFAIAHSSDTKSAMAFKDYIETGLGKPALYMTDGSGVSVAHSGPNGFSIGYLASSVDLEA